MGLGMRIRSLWHLRAGVIASIVIAVFAAVWSVEKVSLAPPAVTPRSLQMATATTHAIVDTPKSVLLDLRQDTYSLESLTNRAVLLGNVMASDPVRERIARRAGVPGGLLHVEAPLTPEQPRPRPEAGQEKSASDILKSTDQYRLSIEANPTVPELDVYAQSPSAATAAALANAAVDELKIYLEALASDREDAAARPDSPGAARPSSTAKSSTAASDGRCACWRSSSRSAFRAHRSSTSRGCARAGWRRRDSNDLRLSESEPWRSSL